MADSIFVTFVASPALVLLAACAASTESSGGSSGSSSGHSSGSGSSSSSSGSTSSSSGSGQTGSSGTGPAGCMAPSMTQTIPFNVSDVGYAASGYMGDGTTLGAIMQLPQKGGDTTCGGDRSPPAKGTCYSITYTPGSMGWGGVYWQYPGNNWGNEGPGISIGPGATKVAVWAKGMTGGEQLVFTVGGINNMHNSGTCADGFEVQFPANSAATKMTQALTTSWAEYDIPLPSNYSSSPGGVIGAFAWVATSASKAPISFKLDSITWE